MPRPFLVEETVMDKSDRSQITRVVDAKAQKRIDPKDKARETASKLLGKRGAGAMLSRPRGY